MLYFINQIFKIVFFILIILSILHFFNSLNKNYPTNIDDKTLITKKNVTAFIINMDKNKDRMKLVTDNYKNSDMKIIPIKRFSAIVGKNVNLNDWLTEDSIADLKEVEEKKYRKYHYQLTRGAIGCFLSHYTLAKQLLADKANDYYFNLEDDIYILPEGFEKFQKALITVDPNWDIILFGYNRLIYSDVINNDFAKVTGFWGTHGLLINKQGAKKFVEYVDDQKIDGQIDAYMSRMAQEDKLNLYAYKYPLFFSYNNIASDIQAPLKNLKDINPYNFKGFIV